MVVEVVWKCGSRRVVKDHSKRLRPLLGQQYGTLPGGDIKWVTCRAFRSEAKALAWAQRQVNL